MAYAPIRGQSGGRITSGGSYARWLTHRRSTPDSHLSDCDSLAPSSGDRGGCGGCLQGPSWLVRDAELLLPSRCLSIRVFIKARYLNLSRNSTTVQGSGVPGFIEARSAQHSHVKGSLFRFSDHTTSR